MVCLGTAVATMMSVGTVVLVTYLPNAGRFVRVPLTAAKAPTAPLTAAGAAGLRADQLVLDGPAAGAADLSRADQLVLDGPTAQGKVWVPGNSPAHTHPLAGAGGGDIRVERPAWPTSWIGKLSAEAVVVGEGRFGKVYLATVECDGSGVAVKLMMNRKKKVDREVALMELFSSRPNFVAYFGHEAGTFPGRYRPAKTWPYHIMMEVADSGDLKDVIGGQKTVTLQQKHELFHGALTAVTQMHDLNIVHRDVKPDNVFISSTGSGSYVAKLGDLGSACQMAGAPLFAGMPECSGTIGTPYYVSPEGFSAKMVHPKNDVWALGLVLYELMFGSKPAQIEGSRNLETLKESIANFDIRADPKFESLDDGYVVKRLLRGMLAHDLGERLSSHAALEMASALAVEPAPIPAASLPECFHTDQKPAYAGSAEEPAGHQLAKVVVPVV